MSIKLILVIVDAVFTAVFIGFNLNNKTDLWLFHDFKSIPVYLVALGAFAFGLIVALPYTFYKRRKITEEDVKRFEEEKLRAEEKEKYEEEKKLQAELKAQAKAEKEALKAAKEAEKAAKRAEKEAKESEKASVTEPNVEKI